MDHCWSIGAVYHMAASGISEVERMSLADVVLCAASQMANKALHLQFCSRQAVFTDHAAAEATLLVLGTAAAHAVELGRHAQHRAA